MVFLENGSPSLINSTCREIRAVRLVGTPGPTQVLFLGRSGVQPAPPVRENRIGGKRQMTPYQHHTCFNSIKTSAPFQ